MTAAMIIALSAGTPLLLSAALHDLAVRTVPNWLAAAVAVAGLVVQALQGALLTAMPAASAVFVLAALCWRLGWLGGGDVKLLGAASLLVPPGGVPAMLCVTALAGGVLALPYLVARHRLPRPHGAKPVGLLGRVARAERWRLARGGPMPYAVAIASGALFVLYPLLVASSPPSVALPYPSVALHGVLP